MDQACLAVAGDSHSKQKDFLVDSGELIKVMDLSWYSMVIEHQSWLVVGWLFLD